jgi:uncharacterized membrane protein
LGCALNTLINLHPSGIQEEYKMKTITNIIKIVIVIALFAILAVLANIVVSGLTALFGIVAIIASGIWTVIFYVTMTYISLKIVGAIVEFAIIKKIFAK